MISASDAVHLMDELVSKWIEANPDVLSELEKKVIETALSGSRSFIHKMDGKEHDFWMPIRYLRSIGYTVVLKEKRDYIISW
jgi:hypothetical protein